MSKGNFWKSQDEAELMDLYRSRPPDVFKEAIVEEYAKRSGRTHNSVRSKLQGLLKAETIIPESRHQKWNTPPVLEGDYLIMGDLHIPYHDAEFISRCIKLAKKWGINKAVIGGDALDSRAFSHWGEDYEQENKKVVSSEFETALRELADNMPAKWRDKLNEKLEEAVYPDGDVIEEITEARKVLSSLGKQFDEITWIMGNHEGWFVRMLQKTISPNEFSRNFIEADSPKWKVSAYYWCRVISNGEPYQIEHPKNSGKGVSKKFAAKFDCNIIMLHNHHYSVQSDPSGRWLAIESGGCFDKTRIQYESQRHAAMDEHMTGAVILRKGKAHLLNQFSDWDILMGAKL